MCIFCAKAKSDRAITSRERALELLAQLERPDGLLYDDALSLGMQLLSWTESEPSGFRCEEVISGASADCDLSDETPT